MTLRIVVSLFAVAGCVISQAPAASAQKGVLEGRVVSIQGQPLNKTTLRLNGAGNTAPRINGRNPQANGVTTDAAGSFRFEGVEPGRYTLSAQRNGYLQQAYGAKQPMGQGVVFDVAAGVRLTGLSITMTPQGIISGTVEDEDGEPMSSTQVVVMRMSYQGGKRQLTMAEVGNSNPDGTFVVGTLAPGRYYVSAMNTERNGGAGPGYLATFYPGTAEPSGATGIDVAAGAVVRGVEIRLLRARLYQIRGKVTGLTAEQARMNLFLGRTDGLPRFDNVNAYTEPDGSFLFPAVAPGAYVIQSVGNGPRLPSVPVAYFPVTVADEDVKDLVVPLTAPITMTGTVRMEGSAPAAGPGPNIFVFFIREISNGGFRGTVKNDGTLEATGAAPGKFTVRVQNLPPGSYVKRIEFGNVDITHGILDLTSGSNGALEILLSPKAATVSGIVRNEKGDALPNIPVSLWSQGQAENAVLRTASTDAGGAFSIDNLAPGDYRVAAWEDIELGVVQSPEFRAAFDSLAAKITVQEASKTAADMKVVTKETIDAEMAKLP